MSLTKLGKSPLAGALALAVALGASEAGAQGFASSAGPLAVENVADGLAHPWAVQFLADGRLLVTERPGRLRVVADGAAGEPIAGVPQVVAQGQGGLLDVALSPDFATSGRLYLSYSEPGEGGAGTAVMAARLVLEGDGGRLEDQQVIFRMNRFTPVSRHFGSRIAVGDDGNLFVTLGDRGEMDRAQDFADLAGGVARITPEGGVPADNPRPQGWAPELWSKGHRNPQGAAVRRSDGALFTVEHGARGGDELNRPLAGRNYGWPVITYGRDYSGAPIGVGSARDGLEQPLHYWDPSISPSGLAVYEGELFAGWQGDLLSGGLSGQVMVRLDMDGDRVVGEERLLTGLGERIRDVAVAADGAVWAITDEADGKLVRLAATN
jgi:glucose/arabinose dehydrogenase